MRPKIVDNRIAEVETMAVRHSFIQHSFRIYGSLIRAAGAYCEIIPTGAKSGWE